MTTMTTTRPTEPPRDRWTRPRVWREDAGKLVPYTRCTTYVSVLEDTYNLSMWQQRMVAIGLGMRPDLALAVSAHADDKEKLNHVVNQAREAAAASAGATTGTALHALTEQLDRGQELGHVPDAYRADLEAYRRATDPLTAVHIERFTVHDDLRIGGTPDRVVEVGGRLMIADLKTGSIEYGIGKIAMQLAVYAHSVLYDPETYERTPLGEVDLERALVIHLPAGTGQCELVEVDIGAGWQAVQIATQVRDWRKRAKFAELARTWRTEADHTMAVPVNMDTGSADKDGADAPTTAPTTWPSGKVSSDDQRIAEAIATADSVDALTKLWQDNQRLWTDEHTKLAKARRSLLETGVLA